MAHVRLSPMTSIAYVVEAHRHVHGFLVLGEHASATISTLPHTCAALLGREPLSVSRRALTSTNTMAMLRPRRSRHTPPAGHFQAVSSTVYPRCAQVAARRLRRLVVQIAHGRPPKSIRPALCPPDPSAVRGSGNAQGRKRNLQGLEFSGGLEGDAPCGKFSRSPAGARFSASMWDWRRRAPMGSLPCAMKGSVGERLRRLGREAKRKTRRPDGRRAKSVLAKRAWSTQALDGSLVYETAQAYISKKAHSFDELRPHASRAARSRRTRASFCQLRCGVQARRC